MTPPYWFAFLRRIRNRNSRVACGGSSCWSPAWTLRGVILLITVTPAIVAPGVLFPYVVGKATFARALIEVAFGLWLALALRHAPLRLPWRPWARGGSWVLVAFAAWLAASLVSALAGASPARSLWSTYERMQGVVDLGHWFVLAVVAASALRDARDWRLLFTCSVAVGATVCAWGLLDYYVFDGAPDDGRLRALLGNPNYLGAYLTINALIGTGLLIDSLRGAPNGFGSGGAGLARACLRTFLLGAVCLSVAAMWLTASRGALVGLAVGAAVLLLVAGSGAARRHIYGTVAAALVLCLGTATWLASVETDQTGEPDGMLSRLADLGPDDPSSRRRAAAIGAGLSGFAERPLLGWGPENFVVAWGRHARPGQGLGEHFDHAHNKPVEELATKGVLGFAAWVLLWVALARALYRAVGGRRRDPPSMPAAGAAAALAALFAQGLFLPDTPANNMQFALLVAFVAALELRGAPCPAVPDRGRRGGFAGALSLALTLCLIAAALYAVAYRPLAAARIAAAHLPTDAGTVSAESLTGIARAVDAFPPLGNYLRLRMFAGADLASVPDEDFRRALAMIEAQGRAAERVEPWNWRVPAMLALAYDSAAARDARYGAAAAAQVDRLLKLAPPVASLIADQEPNPGTLGAGDNSGGGDARRRGGHLQHSESPAAHP